MSEDALVNTGAVAWPDDFTASAWYGDAGQVAPLGGRRSFPPVR